MKKLFLFTAFLFAIFCHAQKDYSSQYQFFWTFDNGFTKVFKNEKWAILNNKGKRITPFKYDEIEPFLEGMARVKKNDKYGFVNEKGKEIIPPKYDEADDFDKGKSIVKLGKKAYYLNTKGKIIRELTAEEMVIKENKN